MKFSYKHKLTFYFFIVFAIFITFIFSFEQAREKKYKINTFEAEQNIYTEYVHQFILRNKIPINSRPVDLTQCTELLPSKLRVSIINDNGWIVFDSYVKDLHRLDNHKNRPEIRTSLIQSFGINIRKSSSVGKYLFYYAKHYDNYYIRVASPYDENFTDFFRSDNIFLYFIILMSFIALWVIVFISNQFGNSITKLNDFILSAKDGDTDLDKIKFPDDELGEIGNKIVDLYKELKKSKMKVSLEREKLIQHFQSMHEGVCFFTPGKKKIYSNSHFIQYLNFITDQPTLNVATIFTNPAFKDLNKFLESKRKPGLNLFEKKMHANNKHFLIKSILYEDDSFEVKIDDITKTEKTRILKQEMTSNISHELKTPVTSIRGYLETLKEQPDIDVATRQFFIERSYNQIIRLSELIQDISLINRMEEASDMFEVEEVKIKSLLTELSKDLFGKLNEHGIKTNIKVEESAKIEGNKMLVYSIFRNLMENTIAYAGNHVDIVIDNYMEDEHYYYFSYYDTGAGVEEKHLNRLFERFYRVNEGRTRDTGGSGLGLAIVKNAVLIHHGEITAKLRKGGGLEFLFTLAKKH